MRRGFLTWIALFPALMVHAWGTEGPCDAAGRAQIAKWNLFSRPANGTLDETDPNLPLAQRIKQVDDVNDHADQCRAVLGPIPKVNCLDGKIVPVTLHGKSITYRDGIIYLDAQATAWTSVDSCDRPALLPWLFKAPQSAGAKGADPREGCFPNVRIGKIKSGPVDWMFVCHYKHGLHEPKGDQFDFVAMIGSNKITGETCFFGHDNGKTSGVDLVPPGGEGRDDEPGRSRAALFWNNPAHNTCLHCHADNKPWIVTPHLNQSVLGGDGTMDLVPELPSARRLTPQWGYRVIGVVHNWVFPRPKVIQPLNQDGSPDRTCTRCHVLTDQEEGLRFAREAVGLGELPQYVARDYGFLLDPDPWMPPSYQGMELGKAQAAVQRYERALGDPAYRATELDILSPCPVPEALDAKTISEQDSDGGRALSWRYRNGLGKVAMRDDIRFRLAIEGSDGTSCEFDDIAPRALGSDQWSFTHPAANGVNYHYRLQAYRYCFDRTGVSRSTEVVVP